MPRLIYKGDTVENFGKFLPTPYIERIEITTGKIDVYVSLLFNMTGAGMTPDFVAFQEWIYAQNIKLYFVFSPTVLWSTPRDLGIANADSIINKQKNAFEGFYSYEAGDDDPHERLYDKVEVNGESFVGSIIQDEEGNNIYKLSGQFVVPDSEYNGYDVEGYWGQGNHSDLYLMAFTSLLDHTDVIWESHTTITMLSGYGAHSQGDSNLKMPLPQIEAKMSNVAYELLFLNGGKVPSPIQDNYYDSQDALYYGDPLQGLDGLYYTSNLLTHDDIYNSFSELISSYGTPKDQNLQSALDNVSYIVQTFQNKPEILVKLNQFKLAFPEKSPVTAAGTFFQTFKTLLRQNLQALPTAQLLVKKATRNNKVIDLRHRFLQVHSWPDPLAGTIHDHAGWSTTGGHMYDAETFELFLGLYLSSRLGENPAWWDGFRGTQIAPDVDAFYGTSAFLYEKSLMSRHMYTVMDYSTARGTYLNNHMRNFGYFFFDYEKAINYTSKLSQIFNLPKIEAIFDRDLTQQKFKLAKITLDRKIYRPARGWWPTTTTTLNTMRAVFAGVAGVDAQGARYPKIDHIRHISAPLDSRSTGTELLPASDSGYIIETAYGSPAGTRIPSVKNYSYIIPRSFNFARPEGLENYRLMVLEMQDFYNAKTAIAADFGTTTTDHGVGFVDVVSRFETGGHSAFADGWKEFYTLSVEVEDSTLSIAWHIIENYREQLEGGFQTYYDYATAACSADDDGAFNTFFIEGMKEKYGDDMHNGLSPWVMAPLTYYLHHDLLFDTFGGDAAAIAVQAEETAAKISPFTGDFTSLERFKGQFTTLYNTWYNGPDSTIGAKMVDLTDRASEVGWTETRFDGAPILTFATDIPISHRPFGLSTGTGEGGNPLFIPPEADLEEAISTVAAERVAAGAGVERAVDKYKYWPEWGTDERTGQVPLNVNSFMWQNREAYDIWPEGEGAGHIGGGGLPMGAPTSVGASAYTENQVKDFVRGRCAQYAAGIISILKTVNTGYGYGDDRDNTALAMVMNWLVWGADEFVGPGGGYEAFCRAIDYSLGSAAREDDVWDAIRIWDPSGSERSPGKQRWLDMRKIIQEYRTNTTLKILVRNFIQWYHWNNAVSEGPRTMNKDAVKSGITSLSLGSAPPGARAFAISDWNANWNSSWDYNSSADHRQHWRLGLYENGDDVEDYVTDR